MQGNADFYQDTQIDGQVPWVGIGTPLATDETYRAVRTALDEAGQSPVRVSEFGSPMYGEIHRVDNRLREHAAHEGFRVPPTTSAIVHWRTPAADESDATIHLLTDQDHLQLETRVMSFLLDRLAAATDDQRKDAVDAVIAEWKRRNELESRP